MKIKNLCYLVMLSLLVFSCTEDVVMEETMDEGSLKASSVTVTTESALKTAVSNASPGDVITISGTIYLTSTLQLLNSGTSSSKINLTGGTLNCSGVSGWGVKCNGSYWNITYINIEYAGDCGLVFQSGGYNYVYRVRTRGCGDSGLQIYNGSHHNSINYCTSYDNYDVANGGENADGFACKLSAGAGNKFYKCNALHNSDDGWDLYGQPYTVVMDNCLAENNGYGANGDGNGFKLGSAGQDVDHTVTNCTSNYNLACGYDGNGNVGHITTTNSTGTGNGKALWYRIY
ncbi:right-handed parallel beta-helix repeat-containing protein [Geofilum sp. OHC36d9]|uniref:right-handed parallel beta-helix repeat-containing protein n=1 Tax=Geofilum sp. OHC36d9 TaxID=3458413 RepID=UPI004034321E